MIIADENLEQYWLELLRKKGFEVFSIRENYPGMDDIKIIEVAKKLKGILITEDKDFGELVFAHNVQNLSVIFLRYDQPKYNTIETHLLKSIELFYETEQPVFITVTAGTIRIRKL